MWRRLANRIVPTSTVADIGQVHWRIADPFRPDSAVTTVATTIMVSRSLLNDGDPFRWHGRRWTWVRWPVGSLWDLIPPVPLSLGAIPYKAPR